MRKWRMVTTIGPWHKVGGGKAFRFYIRVRLSDGKEFYFADYRIGDLTSRHYKLLPVSAGNEASLRLANQTALDLTREKLAVLD